FKDQLQQVDLGGGGTAYYVYNSGGERVRKVIETQNGARKQQRIYVGDFELYREYEGDGSTVKLEREALHIMDDKQRIALVETRAQGNDGSPAQLTRYQLGNHLGSASLELAEDGALISYEEFHPYGTTAFQAGRSAAEVSLKRYRYTGKERDEETGFNYHSARYYAPWLGQWTSCDPDLVRLSEITMRQIAAPAYAAFWANPVVFIDDNGRLPEWAKAIIFIIGNIFSQATEGEPLGGPNDEKEKIEQEIEKKPTERKPPIDGGEPPKPPKPGGEAPKSGGGEPPTGRGNSGTGSPASKAGAAAEEAGAAEAKAANKLVKKEAQ